MEERGAAPIGPNFEPSSWPSHWLSADGRARLVVDRDLTVVWLSEAAEIALSGRCAIIRRNGRVNGADRNAQSALKAAIEKAKDGPGSFVRIGTIEVESVEVILHVRLFHIGETPAYGLCMMCQQKDPQIPDISELFHLTPAESQVIQQTIQGFSPLEIAEHQGTTLLTTRTHIKRAYSKIGVHSKEQLFALLLALVA